MIVALIATDASSQASAGSNRVLSPTTVAYWQQHQSSDGSGSLDLLVLWRGSWFFRGGSSSSATDGRGGFSRRQATHWMTYGDVTLRLEFTSQSKDFDPATTLVKILDRDIVLRNTNVVLIDGADSGTPTIVGTRYIDPRFIGDDAVGAVVKRTPELFEFLRCDVTLPDVKQQVMIALMCGQMRP
jgi:hypothetical protein